MNLLTIHLTTYLPNPTTGAFAYRLHYAGHQKQAAQAFRNTDPKRLQLRGLTASLQALNRPCTVHLHTDSRWLMRVIQYQATRKMQNYADLQRELVRLLHEHEVIPVVADPRDLQQLQPIMEQALLVNDLPADQPAKSSNLPLNF